MPEPVKEVFVDERKIWWLASYPKSGNTWVRMFINAYISGFPLDLNTSFQYAVGDNHLGYFQCVASRAADNLTATEQVFLRPAVLMMHINMSAAKHVCLKTHHAKVQVDGMPLFPPKVSAGAVYIIRDPRDVAISFANHINESIDDTIDHMGDIQYVNEHQTSKLMAVLTTWSVHAETWIDKNKDIPVKIIRYEDMIKDPEKQFKAILKALGFVNINKDKFKFALHQTTFQNLQALEAKNGFRERGNGEKFFRVGKPNQWKKVLSPEQIEKIEEAHGKVMEQHGYELSKVLV
jgi:hypothetical protein